MKNETREEKRIKGSKRRKESRKIETKKIKSIRRMLVFSFLVPVLLIVLLGVLSYRKASDALISNYEVSTKDTFDAKGAYIDILMRGIKEKALQALSNTDSVEYYSTSFNLDDPEDMAKELKLYKAMRTFSSNTFMASQDIYTYHMFGKNGGALSSIGTLEAGTYDAYLQSKEGKLWKEKNASNVWTGYHAYVDEALSIESSKYAAAFMVYNNIAQMYVVSDLKMTVMTDILKSLNLGEGSMIAFVSQDGREILSDSEVGTKEPIFTKLNYYKESKQSKETSGLQYQTYQGKEYCYTYSKIGTTGAMICGLVPKSTILKGAYEMRTIIILIVAVAVIIALLIGTIVSAGISSTIIKITKGLSQVAEGDLTVTFQTKRKDEFSTLTNGINHMLSNTHDLIKQANLVSSKTKISAKEVFHTTEEMLELSNNIASSIQEVERGSVEQAEDIEQCVGFMSSLADRIREVHSSVKEIKHISGDAETAIGQGMNIVGTLNEKMKATSHITQVVIKGIGELEENSRSVDGIIDVINELSSQTNLLSLNASIEAARAGEAGRGFAVVAEEIHKLADETMVAGNKIRNLIASIQEKTKETAHSAEQAEEIVCSQSKALENTIALFHSINIHVKALTNHVSEIVNGIETIDNAKNDSMNAIENIAAVSQESAAVSEEVNATVANQMEAMRQLEKEAELLVTDIGSLEQAISKFKII